MFIKSFWLQDKGRGLRCVLSEKKEEARGFALDTFNWFVCYLWSAEKEHKHKL